MKKLKIEKEEKEKEEKEKEEKEKEKIKIIQEEENKRKKKEQEIKNKNEEEEEEKIKTEDEENKITEEEKEKTIKNNNDNNEEEEKNSQNDNIYKEPRIGLKNIGGTFYMNATIQCLIKTIKLKNYFLEPNNKDTIFNNNIIKKNNNTLELSTSFYELFQNLWDKNNKNGFYSPINFKQKINQMNSLFQGYNSGDSRDLINFIFTQLHKELNIINYNNNKNTKLDTPYYQYDRNQVLNIFFEEFKRDHNSIIFNLFFGVTEHVSECLICKKKNKAKGLKYKYKYNFQYINCIIFPLENVRNYRNNKFMQMNANIMTPNMMTDILNNNRVFIIDCFEYYQNPVIMKDENQIYCNVCKKKCDSNYRTKIYYSPEIMILVLDRGENIKYNVEIDFLPSIDITEYIDKNYAKGNKFEYDLYAVLTYVGENYKTGHYIAFCKCHDDTKKWVCYNDDNVSEIIDFINQVHDYGMPYILFYEKK